MPRPGALLKRSLIFVHRWLGVALSVIFGLWFVSGIVMMYWTYPSVTPLDRLERAPALRAEQVVLSAEEALAALGRDDASPTDLRLSTFDGRPVYRLGGGGRGGPRGGGGRPFDGLRRPRRSSGLDRRRADRSSGSGMGATARRRGAEGLRRRDRPVDD